MKNTHDIYYNIKILKSFWIIKIKSTQDIEVNFPKGHLQQLLILVKSHILLIEFI